MPISSHTQAAEDIHGVEAHRAHTLAAADSQVADNHTEEDSLAAGSRMVEDVHMVADGRTQGAVHTHHTPLAEEHNQAEDDATVEPAQGPLVAGRGCGSLAWAGLALAALAQVEGARCEPFPCPVAPRAVQRRCYPRGKATSRAHGTR